MGNAILASGASSTVITPADWKSVLDAMVAQISIPTVVGVLASCVGVGIGLVFMWWGVRKTARVLMAAFRNGKLKF